MNIQIHADEVGRNLVDETHDIHVCFLNAYFEKVAREYKGGYSAYISDMAKGLGGDALLIMKNIVEKNERTTP